MTEARGIIHSSGIIECPTSIFFSNRSARLPCQYSSVVVSQSSILYQSTKRSDDDGLHNFAPSRRFLMSIGAVPWEVAAIFEPSDRREPTPVVFVWKIIIHLPNPRLLQHLAHLKIGAMRPDGLYAKRVFAITLLDAFEPGRRNPVPRVIFLQANKIIVLSTRAAPLRKAV